MLYFLHHATGNVVIRTNNPFIALQHQRSGWTAAASFDDVLEQHPEWQVSPAQGFLTMEEGEEEEIASIAGSQGTNSVWVRVRRFLATVSNPFTRRAGTSTRTAAASQSSQDPESTDTEIDTGNDAQDPQDLPSPVPRANAAPSLWLTALERNCLATSDKFISNSASISTDSSALYWLTCTEADEPFEYRLVPGVWEFTDGRGEVRGLKECDKRGRG